MTVIVTGSSGLLGRHVAGALVKAGHAVLGLDAVPPPADAAWGHVTVDLTDLGQTLQLVRNAEAVVHIAAIPRPTGLPASQVFRTNMATVYNVVEAAVLNGAARLVYASSMSVLGYPFFETPIAPSYLPLDFGASGRAPGCLCPLEMAGRGGGRGGRPATAGPHGGQPSHALDPDRGDVPPRRRRAGGLARCSSLATSGAISMRAMQLRLSSPRWSGRSPATVASSSAPPTPSWRPRPRHSSVPPIRTWR